VVLPRVPPTQIAAVLRYCHDNGVACGRVAPEHFALGRPCAADRRRACSAMAKFSRIRESFTLPNTRRGGRARVTNLAISMAVQAEGFYYAPDPSSQIACNIGGNVRGEFRRRGTV